MIHSSFIIYFKVISFIFFEFFCSFNFLNIFSFKSLINFEYNLTNFSSENNFLKIISLKIYSLFNISSLFSFSKIICDNLSNIFEKFTSVIIFNKYIISDFIDFCFLNVLFLNGKEFSLDFSSSIFFIILILVIILFSSSWLILFDSWILTLL